MKEKFNNLPRWQKITLIAGGGAIVVGAGAFLGAPVLVSALGFKAGGIAAGSAAAATQSAGVLRLGLTTKAIIGTAGAVVEGAVMGKAAQAAIEDGELTNVEGANYSSMVLWMMRVCLIVCACRRNSWGGGAL